MSFAADSRLLFTVDPLLLLLFSVDPLHIGTLPPEEEDALLEELEEELLDDELLDLPEEELADDTLFGELQEELLDELDDDIVDPFCFLFF